MTCGNRYFCLYTAPGTLVFSLPALTSDSNQIRIPIQRHVILAVDITFCLFLPRIRVPLITVFRSIGVFECQQSFYINQLGFATDPCVTCSGIKPIFPQRYLLTGPPTLCVELFFALIMFL
jgi:hypothetical protein